MAEYVGLAGDKLVCDYCDAGSDTKVILPLRMFCYGEYTICGLCMTGHGFTPEELEELYRGTLEMPRFNSLVKFDKEGCSEKDLDNYQAAGLDPDGTFLFMGEIRQMPGHCIVADGDGITHFGFHTENFVELEGDEI